MKQLLSFFAALAFVASASAQIIVVKAGADGKVFEPSPLTLTAPVFTTPTLGVATATSINKVTITAPATGATLTLVEGGSLITAGAYAITLTSTATTGLTLPTTGTLSTLAGAETFTNKTLTSPIIAINNSDFSVTGTIESADATTPILSTATGKTNTGYLSLTGKTSGSIKVLPADATGQIITITNTAQTVGATTLTIPDFANVSDTFVFVTLAQTLANKTLTTPVIGAATGTSLAVTGTITSSSPSAKIGYATGAGLAATQATSKSTTTANAASAPSTCGTITMNNETLNAGVIVSFTFTNSAIAATDLLILNHISGGTIGSYAFNAQAGAGSAVINVRNSTAGNLGEAIVIQYAVFKAVAN